MESIKEKARALLGNLEEHLVTTRPQEFPAWRHGGPLPDFDVILDWGREGNWKDPLKKVPGDDTSHRKMPTLMYK